MKKWLFIFALLISGSVVAGTEHYFLRADNHVHHMKISQHKDEYTVRVDVDFDPDANQKDVKPCSADITGEAKSTGQDTLTLKKHSEEGASNCLLNIKFSPTGAKIEESANCSDFTAGTCHFSSDGQEMLKLK